MTYSTVLKRKRRELHGKVAQWLAMQTGVRANDFVGVAAEQFEEAEDPATATKFDARVAELAKQRMATMGCATT